MYYIIGTAKQMEIFIDSNELILPPQVLKRIMQVVETLDECYGDDRDIEASLGGYAVIFSSMDASAREERKNIFQKYHIQENEYEYCDLIISCNNLQWMEKLFILSSDFNILMIYPKPITGGEIND